MTDNEIIKALECCGNPLYYCNDRDCKTKTMGNAIDLINRVKRQSNQYRNQAQAQKSELTRLYKQVTEQKAEIERLQKQLGAAEYCIREIDVALYHGSFNDYCGELIEKYNNLVKAMTGI